MEPEPIWMICEGSGCPAHVMASSSGPIFGVCAMCGSHVECAYNGVAILHKRHDILAEVERGDFDSSAPAGG